MDVRAGERSCACWLSAQIEIRTRSHPPAGGRQPHTPASTFACLADLRSLRCYTERPGTLTPHGHTV